MKPGHYYTHKRMVDVDFLVLSVYDDGSLLVEWCSKRNHNHVLVYDQITISEKERPNWYET